MTRYQSIKQTLMPGPKDGLKAHLVRGSTGALILKVCNTALVLISGILLARLLGARGYGTYAYSMALVQLISMPMVMGFPQFIVRNVAAYHSRKDFSRLRGLLTRSNQFVLGLALLLGGISAGIAFVSADRIGETGLNTFYIALMLIPLLGLNNLRMATLRGLKYIVPGLLPEMLIRPLVFIVVLICFYFFGTATVSPENVMGLQVFSTGLAFMAGAYFLIRLLPGETKNAEPVYETGGWLKSTLPFMFLGAMQLVNNRTDIIMLGMFCRVEDVGIYRAAVQGARLVIFILSSVNMVLAPTISGLYAENDMKKLQRLITISARIILAGTLPIILCLYIGGPWVLSFLFGSEFAAGASALRILCLGQLVNSGMGSVGIILNMTGHERYAVTAAAVSAVLNIVLNAVLIPLYGISGAATGTAISLAVWNFLLAWWVFKKVGLRSTAFVRLRA